MIILALIVFGLIFGSFVNALVWRFHEQAVLSSQFSVLRNKKRADAQKLQELRTQNSELSMVHGRSMCSNCHHELAVKDLVPLFSWLWLRGKCRYCGVKIQDNPLIEVFTAVFFALSYSYWPLTFQGVDLFRFIIWLLFVVAFMALAAYDLRWFLLPDRIVFPLIALACLDVAVVAITKHDPKFLLNAVAGAVLLSGLFYVLFRVSDGTWIGGGDVKLAVVLGLLAATPAKALLLLFASSVTGTIFALPQLLKGKSGLKVKVPYGPFLLLATAVTVLFGDNIINWYSNLLIH